MSEPLKVKVLRQVQTLSAILCIMYSNEPSDASVNPLKNAFSCCLFLKAGEMQPTAMMSAPTCSLSSVVHYRFAG